MARQVVQCTLPLVASIVIVRRRRGCLALRLNLRPMQGRIQEQPTRLRGEGAGLSSRSLPSVAAIVRVSVSTIRVMMRHRLLIQVGDDLARPVDRNVVVLVK